MKKALLLAGLMGLVFLLAGCGNNGGSKSDAAPRTQAGERLYDGAMPAPEGSEGVRLSFVLSADGESAHDTQVFTAHQESVSGEGTRSVTTMSFNNMTVGLPGTIEIQDGLIDVTEPLRMQLTVLDACAYGQVWYRRAALESGQGDPVVLYNLTEPADLPQEVLDWMQENGLEAETQEPAE